MEEIQFQPLTTAHLEDVRKFADKSFGEQYYSTEQLKEIFRFSLRNGKNASLCAWVGAELAGIRLTYAPGNWLASARAVSPELWNVPAASVAYFKSLFVAGEHQQKRIGSTLSGRSIEILKEMRARAVLCHSWLESPGNSSQKYLLKMGFEEVAQHPHYWKGIDYMCVRCAPERCVCTATEMILYL